MPEDDLSIILMYHDVRDPHETSFPRRYDGTSFLTTLQFQQQLDFLESHYHIISLSELIKIRANGDVPPRTAVLTFDDGLADHFDRVRPELLKRGHPASFFVPTAPVFEQIMIPSHKIQFLLASKIGDAELVQELFQEIDKERAEDPSIPANAELWDQYSVSLWPVNTWPPEHVFVTRLLRSGLQPSEARKRVIDRLFERLIGVDETAFSTEFYLTPAQAQKMYSDGFEIGSHGHTSDPLTMLTSHDLREDLLRSKSFLTSRVFNGAPPKEWSISYPNGALNETVAALTKECGFSVGLTTESAPLTGDYDHLQLPRFNAPVALPPKGSL